MEEDDYGPTDWASVIDGHLDIITQSYQILTELHLSDGTVWFKFPLRVPRFARIEHVRALVLERAEQVENYNAYWEKRTKRNVGLGGFEYYDGCGHIFCGDLDSIEDGLGYKEVDPTSPPPPEGFSELPPEIFFQIVDYLRPEHKAVLACVSTTCNSYVTKSSKLGRVLWFCTLMYIFNRKTHLPFHL
jgi:hypothetical protein